MHPCTFYRLGIHRERRLICSSSSTPTHPRQTTLNSHIGAIGSCQGCNYCPRLMAWLSMMASLPRQSRCSQSILPRVPRMSKSPFSLRLFHHPVFPCLVMLPSTPSLRSGHFFPYLLHGSVIVSEEGVVICRRVGCAVVAAPIMQSKYWCAALHCQSLITRLQSFSPSPENSLLFSSHLCHF